MDCFYCRWHNGSHGAGCPDEPGISVEVRVYRQLQFRFGQAVCARIGGAMSDDPNWDRRQTAFKMGFIQHEIASEEAVNGFNPRFDE